MYLHRNGKEVNIQGAAALDFGHGQNAQLSFGFNNYYRNTYSIWGEKGQITVLRAFSIPSSFKPKIILEKQDYYKEITCDSDDHFVNEIDYFSKMIQEEKTKIKWYREILSQASIINKINS